MLNFDNLLKQIESVTAKKTFDNSGSENYWRMTKDKAGNASAVIRFLPSKNIDDVPFVRLYTHSFKDPTTNRWYIENSLSTIGQQDALGAMNSELWNTGKEENKELAKTRKRKLNFISNILVVKDSESPENEGKVFLFKYGQKIFNKIVAAAKPEDGLDEDPINAFDPESGADFLLKQTIVAGFPNYDGSKFSSKKPIPGGSKRIQEVLNQCYDINLEVAADKFKSPEELEKKLNWVLGLDKQVAAKKATAADYDDELEELTKIAEAPAAKKVNKSPPMPTGTPLVDDDDEEFFKSLVDD
jgi:hypothetical protein